MAQYSFNADLKGVVREFPDIFKMPHFTSVTYNPIPLDAAAASTQYWLCRIQRTWMDSKSAFGGAFSTAEQLDARKITLLQEIIKPY